MAFEFTVEDGTGVNNSNSYISVSDADDYFSGIGGDSNTSWTALTEAQKEAALVRSTLFLDSEFSGRWIGTIKDIEQSLAWPRIAIDVEGRDICDKVPVQVEKACCELALKSVSADLRKDVTDGVTGESVGSINMQYLPGSTREKRYLFVERILSLVLSGSRGCQKLVRA